MTNKHIIASGKYLRFVSVNEWEFVERTNASGVVVIVAVTDDGKLILTEQYRTPVDGRVIELPAGLAGDAEGCKTELLSEAARRELLEETGYHAESFTRLAAGPSSAGLTSEVITFFLATGLKKVAAGGGDASEDIQVHEVPFMESRNWLEERSQAGVHVDPKLYAALLLAADHLRGEE